MGRLAKELILGPRLSTSLMITKSQKENAHVPSMEDHPKKGLEAVSKGPLVEKGRKSAQGAVDLVIQRQRAIRAFD